MTERHVTITPRDPVIARDGRPFSAGSRMKPVDWLYPSVVAGSVRTLLGKANGGDFDPATCAALKAVVVHGALPAVHESDAANDAGTLCFPAPKDFTFPSDTELKDQTFASRPVPFRDGEGCDLPHGVRPALLHPSPEKDFKPGKIPAWWSRERMVEWLTSPLPEPDWYRDALSRGGFFQAAKVDERMHVQIQEGFGTADDGMLYSTSSLDLSGLTRVVPQKDSKGGSDAPDETCRPGRLSLAVRIERTGRFDGVAAKIDELQTIGGERRIARFETRNDASSAALWKPPERVIAALDESNGSRAKAGKPWLVRLVLATPGLFEAGWHPDFLEAARPEDRTSPLEGEVPGTKVKVRLVGACVERWKPISGWSLENGQRGPKPVRRLVPAGSVYFFEVVEGDASQLASRWLKTVCTECAGDKGQPARDGFGLALWGVWDAPP